MAHLGCLPMLLFSMTSSASLISQAQSKMYVGSMLGVTCSIRVSTDLDLVKIDLTGFPVGGRLSGTATFGDDGHEIVLDPVLDRAIKRRFVQIHRADYSSSDDSVVVQASLPVIGRRSFLLRPLK
jgi:hypothetical protein